MAEESFEKPTIYTIAKLAGVSHTTVSRALNGHPKVSAALRTKIEAIATSLGYAGPNRHAIALRTKRSQMIGVLLMDLVNPYNSELAREIDTELRTHGFACMVSGCDGDGREAQGIANLFADSGVDVIITNVAQPLLALEKEHAPPAVLVSDARIEGFAASVHIKVFEGTYRAISRLIEMGHRRIAHLGAGGHGERYKAYAAAMREAGLNEELWAYGDQAWGRQQLQARVEAIVRERLKDRRSLPTAVVAHDDFMALTVLQTAREMGLSVPEDLSILGHDDTLVTRLVTPRLSSISIPIGLVGRTAARLALKLSGVDMDDLTDDLSNQDALSGPQETGFRSAKTGPNSYEFAAVPTWRESTAPPRFTP